MTTVMFCVDHVEPDGFRRFKAGQLVLLEDGEAQRLAADGIVEIRTPPEPTEFKTEEL